MPTLNIYVTGHKVTIDSGQRLSSGSNKWDKLKFTFDASWDGLTKYASLSGDKVNFTRTQLDSNNECTITDTQIPTEGILYIGAYGTGSNDVRATTSLVRVDVAAGSALGTVPLTQAQYNNLIDQVTALNTDLSQVKNRVTALESGTGTGSGGGSGITKITYAQYQALTSTQKQNGVYYITDYPNASSGVIIVDGEASSAEGMTEAQVREIVASYGYTSNTGTYSKPSGGIPESDLDSDVQASLGKADSAYQKPATGITATDLASAVQTSLNRANALTDSYINGLITSAINALGSAEEGSY